MLGSFSPLISSGYHWACGNGETAAAGLNSRFTGEHFYVTLIQRRLFRMGPSHVGHGEVGGHVDIGDYVGVKDLDGSRPSPWAER